MAESPERPESGFSETQWRSLRYLNLYRFTLAGLLFVASVGLPGEHSLFLAQYSLQHVSASAAYLLLTVFSVMSLHRWRSHFNLQLTVHVAVDVLVLTTLMYASGGLRSGFGILLLVSLAGAGLVGQGRLVLSYAALATLAVLGTEVYRALTTEFESSIFFQAGLLSAGFFATAISARMLAKRVLTNEELARQRGIALDNQMLISQRVIEEMQDGVLVIGQNGTVRQHNPRAAAMLGRHEESAGTLVDYCPALAAGFEAWKRGSVVEPEPFRVASSGLTLRARFLPTESSERDVLVLIEDMGRVHERARQIKLAALGRLTANIAHEIRNPLSAISHAGELLVEERRGETQDRLLRIVRDNTQRLERIVRDVLELGRRDRVHREAIDAAAFLTLFTEEFCGKERLACDVIRIRGGLDESIWFDRSHLHQVLWNVIGNAVRYSRQAVGSVTVEVAAADAGHFELHVRDDGAGVPDDVREHLFEPFFTTHSRGTGLGLYIARELCEANGARLELMDNAPGAHFRIRGDLASDRQSC
jgi:two-component system, NtrC family, sensor histidine kinase PilS